MSSRFGLLIAIAACGIVAFAPATAQGRGQAPCTYELLSLDISTEHAVRLLRKCVPKEQQDAVLLAAVARARGTPATPAPAPWPGLTWASWLGSFFRSIWWIAWPLTVLALAAVAAAVIQPLSRHVWRRDAPKAAVPGADIVIARNLAQSIGTAARVDAEAQATALVALFPSRPAEAMSTSTNAAVQAAHVVLVPYFEAAYAAMLTSQLSALKQRLAAGLGLTLTDVRVYYDRSVELGASLSLRDWIDYLDRFGFVTQAAAAGGTIMTSLTITDLGRIFVGWCDVRGFSPQSMAGSGRVF
jgi:hypothetical protein